VRYASDFLQIGRGRLRVTPRDRDLAIQGWAIGHDSAAVAVELADECDRPIGQAAIGESRPDVAQAFPSNSQAGSSGFRLALSAEGAGESEVRVLVKFSDGSASLLGSVRTVISPQSASAGRSTDAVVKWSEKAFRRESEKVLFGRDGWLYLRRDTNDVLGQQTGRVRLGDERLKAWRGVLEERMAMAERCGALWSCLVAPDKESVYPENLPVTVKQAKRRPIHEFLDVAEAVGAPVSYAREGLIDQKREAELFSRTDTHWNYRGAYLAYRMLCRNLIDRGVAVEVVEESSIRWSQGTIEGDLGSKVEPEPLTGPTIRAKLERERGRLTFDNAVQNHGRVMSFEREGSPGLTCVLFGESFAHYLLVFLKETFSRLVFVHTNMLIEEVLQQERADVAISLPLERFLLRVPDDGDGLAQLQAIVLRKGGSLPWSVASTDRPAS
jgi:alginate O-acetyltransferase complex protein AlgJ